MISLENIYWGIRNRIFPQNESIRKVIPRKFCDCDYLIEEVLFAALIRWVDEEDGLFPKLDNLQRDYEKYKLREDEQTEENLQHFEDNWGGVENFKTEYHKSYNTYVRLREAYYWAKRGRLEADQKLMELSRKLDSRFPFSSFNREDQEYLDYRQWMEKEHDKHLTTIFELRGWLWT